MSLVALIEGQDLKKMREIWHFPRDVSSVKISRDVNTPFFYTIEYSYMIIIHIIRWVVAHGKKGQNLGFSRNGSGKINDFLGGLDSMVAEIDEVD